MSWAWAVVESGITVSSPPSRRQAVFIGFIVGSSVWKVFSGVRSDPMRGSLLPPDGGTEQGRVLSSPGVDCDPTFYILADRYRAKSSWAQRDARERAPKSAVASGRLADTLIRPFALQFGPVRAPDQPFERSRARYRVLLSDFATNAAGLYFLRAGRDCDDR